MTRIAISLHDLRRKALVGALAGSLLLGVAACGSATDSPGSGTAPAAATAPAAPAGDSGAAAAPTMDMGAMPADSSSGAAAPTPAGAAAPADSAANAVQVQATLKEWGLALSQTEVPAGAVRFTVTNTGRMAHNFTIKDASGKVLANTSNFPATAGAQTLDVTLAPGTYTVYCSLPGHAARGQQNTLVVK